MTKNQNKDPDKPTEAPDLVFRHLVETSAQGMSITDLEGKILFVNPALCRLLGEDGPETAYRKDIFAYYSPSTARRLQEEILPIAKREGQWVGELTLVDLQGQPIPTLSDITLIRDEEGKPLYWANMVIDISERRRLEFEVSAYREHLEEQVRERTVELEKSNVLLHMQIAERKLTEEALQKDEAMLRSLLEATPAGVGLLVNRVFLKVNKALSSITGYSEQEMLGLTTRILYPDDEEFLRVGRDLYGQMESEGLGKLEARLKRKDGVIIYVILCLSPFDPEDLSAGVCATVLDITERKQIELKLKESEQMFRTIVENSYAGIYTSDQDFRFTYVNDKFCEITGYTREELSGIDLRSLLAEESRALVADRYIRRRQGEDLPVCYEFVGIRRDGEKRFMETIASVVRDAAGKVLTIGQLMDITESKRTQEGKARLEEQLRQAQKMESIGQLAGGVAHDFNNLLTAILGNTELALMDMDAQDKLYARLMVVKKAAKSAAELTKQLLAFSRKQIIEPKVINLNDLIENMNKMLVRLIGENITLRTNPQAGLFLIKVDPGQIEQIILNLVVNARDAMPEGGVLTMETANVVLDEAYRQSHAYAALGEHVMLAVSDTGTGMDEDIKQHLFEPFFTTKAQGKGTGLGLATVYGVVRQNDGTIEIYSEPGQGTCFKIYFPRAVGENTAVPMAIGEKSMPGGNETVLVVEDNPLVLEFARGVLEHLGYRVLTAASGEEALDLYSAQSGEVQLLMTDVILPGMNGRRLADVLIARHPDLKVLYDSGYTADGIVNHGVLEQGLHFIGKPFSAYALAHKIREVLDGA